MEIMFDMERHPWCFTSRYFRRSFFQTIRNCVPRARCVYRLCTFMHLPSSYLLPASLWNTFRHTDLYENKGKRWGEPLESENWISLCSWTVPRRGILLAPSFVLVTFCNYLSQRQSNVFDNKFNDSIFVFTLKTAWNNLFLNLIQRQILCNKTFCRRKIVTLFLYWNLDFGILSIVRGNGLGRLIFALVCNVFRQV